MKILGMTATGLGGTDWKKIGKGFLIGLAGAVLTYVTSWIGTYLNVAIPPQYLPIVMLIWTPLVHSLTKILDGVKQ